MATKEGLLIGCCRACSSNQQFLLSDHILSHTKQVRLYNIWLDNTEIDDHLETAGLFWQHHKQYLVGYFPMDENEGSTYLKDYGIYGESGLMQGGVSFVEVRFGHAVRGFNVAYRSVLPV